MSNIGIVGTGFAGLHLALFLQQQGIFTTLYSEKTSAQFLASRLHSTPARFAQTVERERQLKVDHWGADFHKMELYLGGDMPLGFTSELTNPGSFVDPRLYSARLLEDYIARGGVVLYGSLNRDDIEALSENHDLMVIAAGRGTTLDLFPRIAEHSPYTQPQRNLAAGYFTGIYREPGGMNFVISPGHGEIFQGTLHTANGPLTNLLIEGIPGGEIDQVIQMRYEDDPTAFELHVLDMLRRHAPPVYANIEPEEFGVVGPMEILQGAITPTVRRPYAPLPNGKYAVAIGDIFVTNDPILGQGANAAVHSAWVMGEHILKTSHFDETFCKGAEEEMWQYAKAVTEWSNAFLQPPPPHMIGLMIAAAQCQPLANAFADNFTVPQLQWEILSGPARTEAFIKTYMPVPA